jgi:hypothetical protein
LRQPSDLALRRKICQKKIDPGIRQLLQNVPAGIFAAGLISARSNNIESPAGKVKRGAEADAGRGSGDQDGLFGEIIHGIGSSKEISLFMYNYLYYSALLIKF